MKKMTLILAALLLLLPLPLAVAQTPPPHRSAPARQAPAEHDSTKAQASSTQENARRRFRHLTLYFTLSNILSSNIDQDEDDISSYGVVPSVRVHYQNRSSNPTFEIDYELASHTFTNTDKFNRVSQNVRASFARPLTRRLKAETVGGVSFKGTADSDSREVGDQYTVLQAFEYRLDRRRRMSVFGAYRIKRFRENPDRNAVNPYFGGKFAQRFGEGRRWEVGYRYDWSRAASSRRSYIRWTYSTEFSTPVSSRDELTLAARYRPQLYARQVRVGDMSVPRRDQKWILSASWRRSLRRDLEIDFIYAFENRTSNDPERKFSEHLAGIALTYRWKR